MIRPLAVILGGTFDPVHSGHLGLAETLRDLLRLPRVTLLPAYLPPHKDPADITPVAQRVAMLRLAVHGRRGLHIDTLELERKEVCYTIDTLRRLRHEPPGCDPVFVLGSDSLRDLPTWRSHLELMREFDLLVIDRARRAGHGPDAGLAPEVARHVQPTVSPRRAGATLLPAGLGRGGRIFPLDVPTLPVSSSEVRARAARGDDLAGLVPAEVAGYIQRHGLYRREDPS